MQQKCTDKLITSISSERLNGYERELIKRLGSCSALDCYAYYNWNTILSESFYTSLQALEVSLRNTIHSNASKHFNSEKWFENPNIIILHLQQNNIQDAKETLKRQKKNLSAGRIIAELNFGFWTSLFNSKYDQILWHPLIKSAFPGLKAKDRTRSTLSLRLSNIRKLRNRIFHYEPIWYYPDLEEQHAKVLEAINWINPAMKEFVLLIDQFPTCYNPEKLSKLKADLM